LRKKVAQRLHNAPETVFLNEFRPCFLALSGNWAQYAPSAEQYAAETKRLNDWLFSYENSKRTESEIAEASYSEQLKNLEELNKRGILIGEAYELKKFAGAVHRIELF